MNFLANISAARGGQSGQPKTQRAPGSDVEELSDIFTSLDGHAPRYAVLLHNILTPEECLELIQRSENIGFEMALVNVGGGRQMALQDQRNSERCIIDDPKFAELLYQRILAKLERYPNLKLPLLDWKMKGKKHAVGLNERLRVLKYERGCYFKPHSDGSYMRGVEAGLGRRGEASEVTMLLYLNEGYDGCTTRFLDNYGEGDCYHDVVPRTGSVLLFEHRCAHEGTILKNGRKYVVRSDLMYTRKGPGHEYSNGLYQGEQGGTPTISDIKDNN